MSKAAAFTINLSEEKIGFFSRVPMWFGAKDRKLSPSARAIVGKIFGVSRRANNAEGACWTSYDQIQEEFGVCRATVSTSLERLRESELIEEQARDRSGTAFRYIADAGKRYDMVPLYLYTADFKIGGKDRRLTKSQVYLLAHLMTECKRPKNNGKCECSIARLARTLDLSETTIKKGIKVLLKAGLIFRAAEDKGVNGSKLTTYHVNRELYVYEQYRNKKSVKAQKTAEPKAIADANAQADWKAYYERRATEMKDRAEKYKLKAYEKAPKLQVLDHELSQMRLQIAKADLYDRTLLPVLESKYGKLESDRAALMQRFGFVKEAFKPEYYAKCKKCGDTGNLINGKGGCTCFREREDET